MNPINHFEQNRPVHLARRDVYFEKAAKLISKRLQRDLVLELNTDDYEEILFMLRTARQHAKFAIRNTEKNEHDRQFTLFINLLAGNVKAVLSMINLKGMVESSQGSSYSFLGANQASAGLQAEEYQRRATDIVHSIHNTINLAEEPFEKLKAENRVTSTEEENERYEKARNHFTELISEKPTIRRVPTVIRKFLRA